MKSERNLRVLGVVAAAVLCHGLVASAASAAVWKDKGVNVTKLVTLGLSGGEVFEINKKDGMSCEVHAVMTTEGGKVAKITSWEIKACKGFGAYATCEANIKEAKGLPWTVHVNATDLTITEMRIKRTFKNCVQPELDKTIATPTVTLNTPGAITEMEYLGESGTYRNFGTVTVDSPDSGTYGIG